MRSLAELAERRTEAAHATRKSKEAALLWGVPLLASLGLWGRGDIMFALCLAAFAAGGLCCRLLDWYRCGQAEAGLVKELLSHDE